MFHKATDATFSIYDVFYYSSGEGLYVWQLPTDEYMMSNTVGVPINVDGEGDVFPNGFTYNAYPFFKDPTSGYAYLWYDATGDQWVINNILGYGIRETDNGEGESPRWEGDAWFSLAGTDPIGTYVPRGSLKEGTPPADKVVAEGQVEGWTSGTLIGVYTKIAGASVTPDEKYLGWRVLVDQDALEYWEEPELYLSNSVFTSSVPTSIWNDSSDSFWILSAAPGTRDSSVGYWKSNTLLGTYTREYDGEGTPPTPETYEISHDRYSETIEGGVMSNTDQLMAQVAVWVSR